MNSALLRNNTPNAGVRVDLQHLVESIPDAVSIQDAALHYVSYNAAFVALTGLPSHSVRNQKPAQIFLPDQAARLELLDRSVTETAASQRSEEWFLLADGQQCCIELMKTPIELSDGEIGIMTIGREVTESKRSVEALTHSEHLFREKFERSSDAMALLDGSRIVEINTAAVRVLGTGRSAKRPDSPVEMSPEFQSDGQSSEILAKEAIATAFQDGFHRFSWTHLRNNGEEFPAEVTLTPVQVGIRTLMLAVIRDLSDSERNESLLHSIADGLSGEIGDDFFHALLGYLFQHLRSALIFIGQLSKEDSNRVESIAVMQNGERIENFEYDLDDTPCIDVMSGKACVYPREVQRYFPNDDILADKNIESYAGIPLLDESGNSIGILAVLDTKAISVSEDVHSFLKLFANRASAELQRQRIDQERSMAALAFETHEAIMICNSAGEILRVNRAFLETTGYPEEEVIGVNASIFRSKRHDADFLQSIAEKLDLDGKWEGEIWTQDNSGGERPNHCNVTAMRDDEGNQTHLVITFLDTTEQHEHERLIRRKAQEEAVLNNLLRLALEHSVMAGFLDKALELISMAPQLNLLDMGAILLSSENDNSLKLVATRNLPSDLKTECASVPVGKCFCGTAAQTRAIQYSNGSGELQIQGSPSLPSHGHYAVPILTGGELIGVAVLYIPHGHTKSDEEVAFLTRFASVLGLAIRQKQTEEQIQHQARHDALTDLPNKRHFVERLDQALEESRRYQQKGALIWLDLNNLKKINDSLGHRIGDLLLQEVAHRLRQVSRITETVARIGGDEFVILVSGVQEERKSTMRRVHGLAERLAAVLARPYKIQGNELYVTTCIGIVLIPEDGADPDELMRNADSALSRAKSAGKNSIQFYKPEIQAAASERLSLENDLRKALKKNELRLFYQPQVHVETGKVTGVEALLRWQHPERGLVSPMEFIPVAEESGLILPIGEWVLREACRQNMEWQEIGLSPITVAVNISAQQFQQSNFVALVESVLAQTGLAACDLELEITESVVMDDMETVIKTMRELKSSGIQLALDDFGTGYSSLSYLKHLALTKLKVDRSFVKDLPHNRDDAAITATIITMAKNLGLETVVEGVETEEQRDFVRGLGCDQIQGYFYSKPLSTNCLVNFLND